MRILGAIVFVITLGLVVALFFGPRVAFDDTIRISFNHIGADPSAYLAASAADGVRPGAEKEIIWADPLNPKATPVAIVYIHGFSATKEEIRPLPDMVAEALGANVFYTRLTGHGRDCAALAEATVNDWINDTAEALEIGRALGDKVLVISTSTGGALAALAAAHPKLKGKMDGVVFISPNFGVKANGADLLTAPFAQSFVPAFFGTERNSETASEQQRRWWTTSYPMHAIFPMAATAKAAKAGDYDDVTIPAMFIFSDADMVVDHRITRKVAGRWGGEVHVVPVAVGAGDDPSSHVIAGRIMSPGMTAEITEKVVAWARQTL